MKIAAIQKPWIYTLFRGTKVVNLVSYLRLEFNIDFIKQGVSFCMLKDNSKCKCDQGKAISDGMELWVSKIIYKDIYIKEHGLWGCGTSISFSILRYTIIANAFSSDLETHQSQIFPMIALRGVAKLSTAPKVAIFPPPVPCNFNSDQCLKCDRWTTLFLRNLIVAMG